MKLRITRQSLNIGKNQPKQITESQLTIYKGALHSKKLNSTTAPVNSCARFEPGTNRFTVGF